MADRHDNRSSEEIRRDIEGTRSEMNETVDALERKLSVGQIVDEVWGRVSGGGGRSASSAASGLGDMIRDNPVPLALMGLGVAWLAVDRATGSDSGGQARYGRASGPGTYEPAEGRVGPYGGETARGGSTGSEGGSKTERARSKATDAAAVMKQKVSNAAEVARGKARETGERARETGERARSSAEDRWDGGTTAMRERAGDMASRARHGVEHGTDRARRGFWRAVEEQPLALGAVAFGLGLAGGLSAPTSRWEDEHMGRAADSVKHEAGEFAEETAEDAKEVAREASRAAKEEGQRVTQELKEEGQRAAEDVKEAGARVADEATEAGRERARERGMDPESMKKRARRSGTRARDRATD